MAILVLTGCGGDRVDGDVRPPDADVEAPDVEVQDVQDIDLADTALPPEPGTTCDALEAQSLKVRQQSCAQCHGSSPGQAGFWWVMNDAELISVPPPGGLTPAVIPGDPADSPLYQRMIASPSTVVFMPPTPVRLTMFLSPSEAATVVYPTQADIKVIYDWTLFCLGVDGREAGATQLEDASLEADATAHDAATTSDDVGVPPGDASEASTVADVYAPPPPPGEAGFAFIVDGVVQTPLTCPSDNWEFWPFDVSGAPVCGPAGGCSPGSVVLENTGSVPLPYTAERAWTIGAGYVPGVATGASGELAGVLAPGAQVDITSAFAGGTVALVGSSLPFSDYDAHYVSDEGTIPWPGGLDGSGGATQMWVAQIDIEPSCQPTTRVW